MPLARLRAPIAQLEEHHPRKMGVLGSNPGRSLRICTSSTDTQNLNNLSS